MDFLLLLAQILMSVNGMVLTVTGAFNSVIRTVGDVISQLMMQVTSALTALIRDITGSILAIMRGVVEGIAKLMEPILRSVNDIVQEVRKFLTDMLSMLKETFLRLWADIKEVTLYVFNQIADFIRDVWAELRGFAQQIIDVVTAFATAVRNKTVELFNTVISQVKYISENLVLMIRNGWTYLINIAANILLEIQNRVKSAFDTFFVGAQSLLNTMATRLTDLRSAFDAAATKLVTKLGQVAGDIPKPVEEAIKKMTELFMDKTEPSTQNAMLVEMDKIVTGPWSPQLLRGIFGEGWMHWVPNANIARSLLFGLVTVAALIPFFQGMASAQANVLLQDLALTYPYQPLPYQEAVAAYRRGALTPEEATEQIRRSGLSSHHAYEILNNAEDVPAEGDLLSLWLRGDLGDAALDAAMFKKGYSKEWTAQAKKLAFMIPGPQDLITMAVREVFSPDMVSALTLDAEFPKQMADWSKKVGLSETWAHNYWMAHWQLPSVDQGMEMLHRGVIKIEELKVLIKALDVAPIWRQRLIDIAYSPYTRVDIRRMHKLGILSETDVHNAHLALGYEESKAKHLTDFVLKLNQKAPADNTDELAQLSRTTVVDFYRDGVIDRNRALTLLTKQDYTLEAATLYLDAVDMEQHRQDRKAQADHVVQLAVAGTITFQDAQIRLQSLGLEAAEVERELTRLSRELEKAVKIPSEAQAKNMWMLGIISEADYRDVLHRVGYSPKWITAFVAYRKAEKNVSPKSFGSGEAFE